MQLKNAIFQKQVGWLLFVPQLPAAQVRGHPRWHARFVGGAAPGRLGANRGARGHPRQLALRAGPPALLLFRMSASLRTLNRSFESTRDQKFISRVSLQHVTVRRRACPRTIFSSSLSRQSGFQNLQTSASVEAVRWVVQFLQW